MIHKKVYLELGKVMNNIAAAQAPNTAPSFIDSLLANPSAIVSVIAMIVTILLFYINVCVIRKNARVDFERKINLNYYEITVIAAMKELFRIISLIKTEYYHLKNSYNSTEDEGTLKEQCQRHLEKIDEYIECMQNNSLVYLQVYSESAGVKLQDVIDLLDDECVTIISKFSEQNINTRRLDAHTKSFNLSTQKAICSVYRLCKELNP